MTPGRVLKSDAFFQITRGSAGVPQGQIGAVTGFLSIVPRSPCLFDLLESPYSNGTGWVIYGRFCAKFLAVVRRLHSTSVTVKAVMIDDSDPILVRTNSRLLDALQASKRPVLSACGGKGLCATCHIYADARPDALSPLTPREQRSLVMLRDARPSSRLACQAKVLQDGAHILKPGGLYIESATDLDGLVGRRAEEPILHPADGRVLIEAGKIITRTRISALASIDVDVAELRALSLTAL